MPKRRSLNATFELEEASYPSKTPEVDRICQKVKAQRDVPLPPATLNRAKWADVSTPPRRIAVGDSSEKLAYPTSPEARRRRSSAARAPQSEDAAKPSAFMRRKAYDAARRVSLAASSPLPTPQDKGTLFSTPSSSSRPVFKGVKHLPGKDGTPSAAARRLRDSQAQAQRRRATRSVAADKRRGLL